MSVLPWVRQDQVDQVRQIHPTDKQTTFIYYNINFYWNIQHIKMVIINQWTWEDGNSPQYTK